MKKNICCGKKKMANELVQYFGNDERFTDRIYRLIRKQRENEILNPVIRPRQFRTANERASMTDDGMFDSEYRDVQVEEILRKYKRNIVEMRKLVSCLVCGTEYRGYHNLMGLNCKVHSGRIDRVTERYTCCGISKSDGRRCTKSMHVSRQRNLDTTDDLRLPADLVDSGIFDINSRLIRGRREGVVYFAKTEHFMFPLPNTLKEEENADKWESFLDNFKIE